MNIHWLFVSLDALAGCGYLAWLALRTNSGPFMALAMCLSIVFIDWIWSDISGLTIWEIMGVGLVAYLTWFLIWSLRELGLIASHQCSDDGSAP